MNDTDLAMQSMSRKIDLFLLDDITKKQFIAASFIAILIAIPISLMVPMYLDDFLRAVTGSYKWSNDGRPLAEFIYRSMGFDSANLSIISPLGTILCIPGIGFSSVLLCKIFGHRRAWAAALAAVFIFAQPYFLANLSFSLDSPMMVLAIFFSLCSAYLIVCVRTIPGFLGSIFLQVCSLSLYQAANSAMWIPVLLSVLVPGTGSDVSERKHSKYRIFKTLRIRRPHHYLIPSLLLAQLLSLASYRFIVLNNITLNRYAMDHSSLPTPTEIPFTLLTNVEDYVYKFAMDWQNTSLGWVFILFLIICSFYTIFNSVRGSALNFQCLKMNMHPIIYLLLCSLFVGCIFLLSYGLPLILTSPVFEPRTFIGIGVFMASIAMLATRDSTLSIEPFGSILDFKNLRELFVLVVVSAAGWACIFNLFAYSNAYSRQQELNNYFVGSIVQDVRQNGYQIDDINVVEIIGQGPYDPVAINSFRSLPYLRSLIRPISDWSVGMEGKNLLMHYGFINLKNHYIEKTGTKLISSNAIYDLSTKDNSLIIRFRNNQVQK